jgi:hypothetical protein
MTNTPNAYDLVIGLDRSDRKADLSLIETASGERRSETVNSAPEALRQWLLELRQRHRKATVAICLEQPAGHLIPFATSPPSIRVLPCGFNWSVARAAGHGPDGQRV